MLYFILNEKVLSLIYQWFIVCTSGIKFNLYYDKTNHLYSMLDLKYKG